MIHTIHVGRVSILRHEEMDRGQDMPDQDPYFCPTFNGVCSILGIVCFNRSSLQQDNAIPEEIE